MSVRLSLVQLFVGVIVPISNEILFIPSIHCPLYPSLSLRATSLPSISPPSTLPCALGQLFDVAYLCCCGYVERNITMLPLRYVTLHSISSSFVSFRFVLKLLRYSCVADRRSEVTTNVKKHSNNIY